MANSASPAPSRRAERTRRRLLDSVVDLMSERGLASVTPAAIAGRAGRRAKFREGEEGRLEEEGPIRINGVVRGVDPRGWAASGVKEAGHALAQVRCKSRQQRRAIGEVIEVGCPSQSRTGGDGGGRDRSQA